MINPRSPYLENDASYPPMWAMYIAAKIQEFGHTVEIVDLTVNHDLQVENLTADLFMVTAVTPNIYNVLQLINRLDKNVPVILGGAHPTHVPITLPRSNVIVLQGEAESIIWTVLEHIVHKKYFNLYQGGIARITDIRKPDRSLVNLHDYHPAGDNVTPVYASRGCHFSCSFCSRITGNSCRLIPLPTFEEELDDIIGMGFKKFVFGDDNASVNRSRLSELMKIVQKRNLSFRMNQDARTIQYPELDRFHTFGCTDISYGIETGSQVMLDRMNKKTTIVKNERAVLDANRAGIKTRIYLISNFPGETDETIRETIGFVERTRPDSYLISNFSPMPGSDTYLHPEKYGIIWMSKNWSDYYLVGKGGSFKPCFTTDYLTTEKQNELHTMLVDGINDVLS